MSNNQPKVLSGISGSASSTTMDALPIFPGELYVKDAHKSFGVTKALNGCSFSANFGEIHAIVGGNGCGKSTLAKVLSGVLPLDSGKVSILGHHPSSPSESKSVGIATVFQEVMIADEASVVDNLFTGVDGFWTRSMPNSEKIIKAQTLMRELACG
jgi:ribose transport system ATP-binding protein